MIIRVGLLLLSIGIVLASLSSVSITHHYEQNISFSRSYSIDVSPLMINLSSQYHIKEQLRSRLNMMVEQKILLCQHLFL
ncbi:hypothetical protein [Sulfuracidifex tepidarius]|uniref:hypothetical protein n=1 Tax=Sulfuracidifex tepidarius TaxID=1294262 RepID=UPI0006CFC465|nr:hypothetical protein [Sulfuracidifex tepidarius]